MKKLILISGLVLLLPIMGWTAPEIISKRTYNQKVYDLGDGRHNYKIHTAHINYKDENGDFQEIDTTLIQDPVTKQYKQSKASYHCKIPEYADDWFEFYNTYDGANHTIKAKPVASHIKGEYFKGDDGQGVIYKDAFGKGIDLKVYAYWGGLKKVIVINEKPVDTSKDLSFDFEMDLPKDQTGKEKVKDKDNNVWDTISQLNFTDKTLKIGDDGKESYFRNALMWDSSGLTEKVNIQLVRIDTKLFIRKTIPTDFLQRAVFPVYTDHPTSYYSGTGDGYVYDSDDVSWDTIHDSTSGSASTTLLSCYTVKLSPGTYSIYRSFVPIDTSGIDDGANIISASLYLYITDIYDGDNDGDDWINVVLADKPDTASTALANDDYNNCGLTDNPDEGATRIDLTAGFTLNSYNAFVFNSTGISWIVKDDSAPTRLGIREGHDILDHAYAGANDTFNGIGAKSSEDASGTKDPYLDVTVEAGGPEAPTSTILGGCKLGGVLIGR